MGIKQIFQDGLNEFKRRSALIKEKRGLSQKEKLLADQYTALGKKAWETDVDISGYGNSKELISNTDAQINDQTELLQKLDSQKLELEEKKKNENEAFESQRKEVEEKKRAVDAKLYNEKKRLKESQRDISNTGNRTAQIAREEEQLKTKAAAPETTSQEKTEIEKKLETFATEKQTLTSKRETASETAKDAETAIKPLEVESDKLQQEMDRVRSEQRNVIGALDDSLSEVNKEIHNKKSNRDRLTRELNGHFNDLGEKLAAASVTAETITEEMTAVTDTKKEMEDIRMGIQSLEHRGSAASRNALWKMVGVIAAGIAGVVVLIFLISLLTGSGEKEKKEGDDPMVSVKSRSEEGVTDTPDNTDTPGAPGVADKTDDKTDDKTPEPPQPSTTTTSKASTPPPTPEAMQKKLEEVTGKLKEASEKQQGEKIVVTDKAAFLAVLPAMSGWTTEHTVYNKRRFGQLEFSEISTVYTGPDGQKVRVRLSDTGTASASLRVYKMAFNMNINNVTDNGYEKITTYNKNRVIEKFTKEPPRAEFTYIVKDRYLVELKADGPDALARLKHFITGFDLKKLQ